MNKVMKKLFFFLIICLTLFGSCKKDEPVTGVTPAMARDTLYYIMKQWYYWYNLIPTVTKADYKDPYELLEAMRYKTLDRYSFVADYDEINAEMAGAFVGHGFRIGLDKDSIARIVLIYKNSPLYAEGVRRGWIVKKINNVDLAPLLLDKDRTAYNNLIGASTAGVTNTFLFKKPDGTEVTITSTKKSFTINTVISYDTLQLKSGMTGHIVFEKFIEPSANELKTAFAFFKTHNVTDLILDLRYNLGGYFDIAQQLASYIAGNGKTGNVFAKIEYSDKNTGYNRSFPFISTSYSLSLPRLVVITSRMTASASESVMNGLKPYLTVVSTGDTTDGKPTGMNAWPCGKKYWFYPVTCRIVNSLGEGDFYDGIPPDKLTSDDITHDFDDRNEECLKEAIRYLETGAFSGKGAENFRRSVQFSEKPSLINNTFLK